MTAARDIFSKASLSALKSWQLKNWSFLTGLPTSGTKTELVDSIQRHVLKRSPFEKSRSRIVSVDMGIRNLAFCVVETPSLSKHVQSKRTQIDVKTWIRMDLLGNQSQPVSQEGNLQTEESQVPGTGQSSKALKASLVQKGTFEPSSLSQTAYLVTHELLKYKPDVILIERQRFRSGGAAAIQEWTIRVNMLESMLWACLETIKNEYSRLDGEFPALVEMSPSRVANFWTTGQEVLSIQEGVFGDHKRNLEANTEKPKRRSKGSKGKAEKVSTVQSWISEDSDVELKFHDESIKIAEAFRLRKGQRKLAGGKLDDLADCLLQAVSWVRWQENQRRIVDSYISSTS